MRSPSYRRWLGVDLSDERTATERGNAVTVANSGITASSIDTAALLNEVIHPSCGAIALFLGSVRNVHEGRAVLRMEYSAYVPMAEKLLHVIVREAVERYPPSRIAVRHRLGLLELGDVSVAIAVAHPRRAPAFDAARYIIEELKKRVPIWKLEHYADGTREWVDPTRSSTPSEQGV